MHSKGINLRDLLMCRHRAINREKERTQRGIACISHLRPRFMSRQSASCLTISYTEGIVKLCKIKSLLPTKAGGREQSKTRRSLFASSQASDGKEGTGDA